MRLLIQLTLLSIFLFWGVPSMAVPVTSSADDSNDVVDGSNDVSGDDSGDDFWTLSGADNSTSDESDFSSEVIDFNGTNCIIEQVIEVIELKQIIIYELTDAGELLLLSGDDGSSEGDNESDDYSPFLGLRSDDVAPKHNKTTKKTTKKVPVKKIRNQKKSVRAASDVSSNKTSAAASTGNGTCTPAASCQSSSDCGGGKARCIGAAVGTCNCAACVGGLKCSTDAQCGGLKQACNDKGFCDCVAAAHKSKGFISIANTLRTFCNHKKCDADADGCFGLPCNAGRCAC